MDAAAHRAQSEGQLGELLVEGLAVVAQAQGRRFLEVDDDEVGVFVELHEGPVARHAPNVTTAPATVTAVPEFGRRR